MKSARILTILVVALGLLVWSAQFCQAAPMGTAFTYQGRLMDKNKPADGLYDFQFKLYDSNDPCTGAQLGSTIDINDLDVIDGHFIVELDFGSEIFDGNAVWLETRVVESPMGSEPSTLRPLLELTPTPYAIYAETAGGDSDWTISGNDMYSAVSGNVGIGTTSPETKFHVYESSSSDVYMSVEASNSDGEAGLRLRNPAGGWDVFANNDDGDFGIAHALAERVLTIKNSTGNVGIGTTEPDEKLHVVGSIKIVDGGQGANKVLTSDVDGVANWQEPQLPSGVIVMWSGAIANIPSGWALCDGNSGTPDLTSRFIMSVPNASTDPGSTGGASTHVHGGGSYSASSHTHPYSGTTNNNTATKCQDEGGSCDHTSPETYHSHTYSGTTDSGSGGSITGTSAAASTLPPYYELAYIMKLP